MIRATDTNAPHGLIALRERGHVHALRFERRHPLAAYAHLEQWLRDGVICPCIFGYLLGWVASVSLAATEGAA